MSSGPDDKATDWHSLTIETYPRKVVADLDDASAEAKMSAWVAIARMRVHCPDLLSFRAKAFRLSFWNAGGDDEKRVP